MTPTTTQIIDFANKHLQPYRFSRSSREISPMYCPICHGGQNKDRNTFFMNIDSGLACCKRGTCDWKGSIAMLAEKIQPLMETNRSVGRKKSSNCRP